MAPKHYDMDDKERKDFKVFTAMHSLLKSSQAAADSERRSFAGGRGGPNNATRGVDAMTRTTIDDLCDTVGQRDFGFDQMSQPLGDFVHQPALVVAMLSSRRTELVTYIPFFNDKWIGQRSRGLHRAVKQFSTMVNCFRGSNEQGVAEFERLMSNEQIVSMRILMDWWHRPDNRQIMHLTQRHILRLAAQTDWSLARGMNATLTEETDSLSREAMQAEIHRTFMLDALGLTWEETRIHKSMYHKHLLQLFAMEFVVECRVIFLQSKDGDQTRFKSLLSQQRQMCACIATLKDLALAPLSPPTTLPSLTEALKNRRRTLLDPVPWLKLRERHDYNRKNNARDNLPHYLWDVKNRRTVCTKDLQGEVEYTCISYSWGRWRIPVDRPDAFVQMPNVKWKVPRNTRFDVERLPEEFARIFDNQGYLWFDLFVIPQDNSELTLREVSRQDIIFTNAKHCIAWLHDVSDWGRVSHALWSAAAHFGRRSNPVYPIFAFEASELKDEVRTTRQTESLEFFTSSHNADRPRLRDVLGWLTSLWTLQEVCLRPDMVLCSFDWKPLMVGDVVVTFDGLLAPQEYLKSNMSMFDNITKDPLCGSSTTPIWSGPIQNAQDLNKPAYLPKDGSVDTVAELRQLLAVTSGLAELRDLSRSAIFNLASRRTCVESRAEAIMSVIGATKWYQQYASANGRQSAGMPLVLGQYPAVFLNEAARDIGAEFFSSMRLDQCYLRDALGDDGEARWTTAIPKTTGSLLPFTISRTQLCPFPRSMQLSNFMTHDSLASWTVLDSGRVQIKSAAIVASSFSRHEDEDSPANLTPMTREQRHSSSGTVPAQAYTQILVPAFMQSKRSIKCHVRKRPLYDLFETDSVFNLQKWLDDEAFVGDTPVYAVCLSQQRHDSTDGPASFGVLLKEVGSQTSGDQKTLISVGHFFGKAPMDWFKSYPVDWVVV